MSALLTMHAAISTGSLLAGAQLSAQEIPHRVDFTPCLAQMLLAAGYIAHSIVRTITRW